MAFFKVVSLALFSAVALAAPRPQVLTQVHPAGTFHSTIGAPLVRTINSPATVLSHGVPAATVVRTNNVLSHAAVPAATVVRTNNAVHAVHAAPAAATVVRTAPVASVAHLAHAAPATTVVQQVRAIPAFQETEEVVEANPNYSYGYSVDSIETGDSKTRGETRDGDNVVGFYTINDPDGRARRVDYTVTPDTGFQAHVTYNGEDGPPAIPIDTPAATTVVAARASPVVLNSSPLVSHVAHAAPAATVVRTNNAQHLVHAAPATTVVRSSPVATVAHAAVPAATVVRTNNAQHLVHAAPATTAAVVRASPAVTTLSHAASPVVVQQPQQVFRLANGQLVSGFAGAQQQFIHV